MNELLEQIFNSFLIIYSADKRPEARRFTIGCFLIILVAVLLLALFYSVRS